MVDPQGIRLDLLQNEPKYANVRWRYINTPALNENEESNFEYQFGVGFSTEYYQMRRASFERNNDMASWLAQYQGEPIERDGTVFDPDDLRYYNGTLPDADPDRIFMSVDPAWGGGDFVAAPIIYQYGDDLFVADVVYNNGDKRVTQPLLVQKAIDHNVQAIYIEATKTTASYTQEVDALFKSKGLRVNLQSTTKHYTGTGKEQRIFDRAPEIREMMVFLDSGYRSKEYEMFMQNLFAFSIAKKNKNDDAPDSLAIALAMAIFGGSNKVQVIQRPF
jgi:predicted phage terminase large subunit-like protein